MQEEWLPVEEFPEYYVSNYGYVMRGKSGRTLSLSPVQYGMPTVGLMKDGHQYRRSVAGLVARAFLDPPPREDFDTPIHLDGDRKNCRADNLAWRPRWFAINYHKERQNQPKVQSTRDIRIQQTWEVFDAIWKIAEKYGLLESDIRKSLIQGTPVFPQGFVFYYDE